MIKELLLLLLLERRQDRPLKARPLTTIGEEGAVVDILLV